MSLEPQKPNSNTMWGMWAGRIHDWIRSLRIISSPTVRASYTPQGIVLEAVGRGSGTGKFSITPPEEWEDRAYPAGSFCFRYAPEPMDDGTVAGTYYTPTAVVEGDVPPGEWGVDAAASFHPTIVAGVITAVVVDAPGLRYLPSTTYTFSVTDTGGGSGAVVSADTDSDGSFSGGVTVSDGGSGYTPATTTTVPGSVQKWQLFSSFHTPKFTTRNGNQVGILDSGRDALTYPNLELIEDQTTDPATHDDSLYAIASLADLTDATKKGARFRWTIMCIGGVNMRAKVFRTRAEAIPEGWTPPDEDE